MIPHDCSVVIPRFYLEKLRGLARGVGAKRRVRRETLEDMEQEAVAEFLAKVTPKEMAEPDEMAWQRLRREILPALERLHHEESRADKSVEEYPGLLESLSQVGGADADMPGWVPADRKARRELAAKCERLLETEINPRLPKGRSRYRVDLMLMGEHVVMSGDFGTLEEARAARRDALTNIISWCLPEEDEASDSGDAAARFVALHEGARVKPVVFYDDPLNVLVYLEEFRERVCFGHRYWTADAGYERSKKAVSV